MNPEEQSENGESNASDSDLDSLDDDDDSKVSKKKLRKLKRLTVAELKQLVKRPDVVEWVDVTASDPKLLVELKSTRNAVQVPRHWCQKRKYLQGKRGIEKPPFELPDFIKSTGIAEMRAAIKDKEDAMSLKTKARQKMQPKMGKLDIDYQKLHDAFFKYQTKPKLTSFGEVYYEGKEFETRLREKKPGILSEELKGALGMPPLAPPPWLINMQRYGPPPSYPNLRIPGLNAPIPPGAQWGYHPGGWGKPPVDEFGRPLYGDVFGTTMAPPPPESMQPIERRSWGEMEEVEDEEQPEEPQSEEADEEQAREEQEVDEGGLVTPSGLASVPSGIETPEIIQLRKDQSKIRAPERVHTLSSRKSEKVEIALDPSELEGLGHDDLKAKFEEKLREENPLVKATEDFSDLVAEHSAKAAAKKRKPNEDSKSNKKMKEFKF